MNSWLLDLLALGAVVSGILVITAKNPVISVMFLISVFINVAGYLVLLGVAYLGLAYLIIYVGAIAILFLFVIMMLNLRLVELIDTGQEYTQNLPLGAIIGTLFFFEVLSVLHGRFQVPNFSFKHIIGTFDFLSTVILDVDLPEDIGKVANVHWAYNPLTIENQFSPFLQIESIGQALYTYASMWLIVASVILLLAMVGPIVLCMTPKSNLKQD